jgi:lipoate-protein ligase A
MLILDRTFETPEENLAADEALLEAAEAGEGGEVLRFWESPTPFVVLGYTNKREVEARPSTCEALHVPILRRVSGGGTVLQGPFSWNYALVLDTQARPEIETISGSNTWIMEQQRTAMQQVLAPMQEAVVRGTTDLALRHNGSEKKFSGNAQRRKKRFTLFHGTILRQGFDFSLLAQVLAPPSRQPNYRENRSHEDFLCVLPLQTQQLKNALASTWGALSVLHEAAFPHRRMHALINERYTSKEWNLKF